MAPPSLLPVAASLLLVLGACLLPAPADAKRDPYCPVSCASGVSKRNIVNPPAFIVNSVPSISFCRATCFSKGLPYYQFTPTPPPNGTACACFKQCTLTQRLTSSASVQIGYAAACDDKTCPVVCQVPMDFIFIPGVADLNFTDINSTQTCWGLCKKAGMAYYEHGVDQICYCQNTCSMVKYTPGIVPTTLGYVPACGFNPPATCSAFMSKCPKCPGSSTCQTNKGKSQCCCNPPNYPTIRKGQLIGCGPQV